jgi:hypothetical protein
VLHLEKRGHDKVSVLGDDVNDIDDEDCIGAPSFVGRPSHSCPPALADVPEGPYLANITVYPERSTTYASTGEGEHDRAVIITLLPILNASQLNNISVTNIGPPINGHGHAEVDISFTHCEFMEDH